MYNLLIIKHLKEAIVNTSAKYPVTFNTADDTMTIEGFGTFHEDQLVSAECQRYKASRNEVMEITAPSAADLGITTTNVPVTFSIVVKSFREQSEYATDFIINGRPFVFEILVSSGDTSTNVGDAMLAEITGWSAKFTHATAPFTATANAGIVTVTMDSYDLFFRNTVEFRVDKETTPYTATTNKFIDSTLVTGTGATSVTVPMVSTAGLLVGDTVVIGATLAAGEERVITAIVTDTSITVSESLTFGTGDSVYVKQTALDPIFDGKYLEENARMSLSTTSDSYGISPDEKPIIAGTYTSISFVAKDDYMNGIGQTATRHKFLGNTRGELGGERQYKFTLYVLEGTDMFTDGAGNKVFDIVDFLDDSPITPVLRIADGSIAADASAFVA